MSSVDGPVRATAPTRGPAARLASLGTALARSPALFVAAFFVLYGYHLEDFADFAQMTRNPFVTHPDASRQFLHSSPLDLFVGWPLTALFGARVSFDIVCGGGFALLLVALRRYLRPFPAERRATMLFVALATPVLLVLVGWVGKNDAWLLALFLLVLASRDEPIPNALFSTLLVLAHRELGTLMLLGDALLRLRLRPPAIAGLLLGNALVSAYLASLSAPSFSRIALALSFLHQGFEAWRAMPFAHLALSFGWFWMFLFARATSPDRRRVAVFLVLCFGVSLDGADYTRDFLLAAFPLVVYTAEAVATAPDLAGLVRRAPFPLAFLLQMQLRDFTQVRDSWWPARIADLAEKLWHHAS